ncbi:MAG: helix-turn-helix domain-containing protein [Planctomycetota bacterium]|jgi:excisionase family DNA binding protein|nr:helix-turn-helix domain-containing protein [Planctomycetota bacterium]
MKEFSESSPLFLNARQLAGRLGLSVRQVRALAKEGRIPEIMVGKNTRRYDLDAVIAALTHRDGSDGETTALRFS